MKKDTTELMDALKKCSEFGEYYSENRESMVRSTLAEYLNKLADEKNIKKNEVFGKAEISEVYGYQIFSGQRTNPTREKLICLSVAMGLSLEETQNVLQVAGYSKLYPKNPRDCVIIYGVCNGYGVVKINDMLFDYGEELL